VGVVKTIIFDLGGVIVPFDFNLAYTRLRELAGLETAEVRARINATDLPARLESGRIEPRQFARELTALLGFDMDYTAFCELFSCIFYCRETIVPESLLERLKRRHRLLLLSNTNAIHFAMLRENYPLLQHFDRWVLSYEVGAMKPDPRIYREAIRHAECEPSACFFTDDVAAYVEGARREGIDAVQFTGLEKLQEDLRVRGVDA
jgi:putative hydrolase of the HAD superfamily